MSSSARYIAGTTSPDLSIFWPDSSGSGLVDYSTGWSFSISVGDPGLGTEESGFPISTGTGAAGSGRGNSSSDTPNLVVSWSAASLGALSPGSYVIEITATNGANVRKLHVPLSILPEVA